MAVGKSTVGRYLAKELMLDFYDSDRVIEESAGAAISWIFDKEGESGFRKREVEAIDSLTNKRGIVLATGGGAVLREENRRHLVTRGTVIYLVSSLQHLVERTQRSSTRPLLQDGNAMDIFEKLQLERGPLYKEVSDFEYNAEHTTPRVLARNIARALVSNES